MADDKPKAVPFRGMIKLLRVLVGRVVEVEICPSSEGDVEAFRIKNVVLEDVAEVPVSERLHDCDAVQLELSSLDGVRVAAFVLYEDVMRSGRVDYPYQTLQLARTRLTIWDSETVDLVRAGENLPS
jgi:hypothetical protein